jgi:hypothetical protein
MRLPCFAVLLAVIACPLVLAQPAQELPYTSGKAFVHVCSVLDKQPEEMMPADYLDFLSVMSCLGYVSGYLDGVTYETVYARIMTGKEPPRPFCLPEKIIVGQVAKKVLQYIRFHPETASQPTGSLIPVALINAYPCTPPAVKKK